MQHQFASEYTSAALDSSVINLSPVPKVVVALLAVFFALTTVSCGAGQRSATIQPPPSALPSSSSAPPPNLNAASPRPAAKAYLVFEASITAPAIYSYRVDPVSGRLNLLATTQISNGTEAGGILLDPLGRFLYLATGQEFSDGSRVGYFFVYRIDQTSGMLTQTQMLTFPGGGIKSYSMMATSDGAYLYAGIYSITQTLGGPMIAAYSVDGASGTLTPVPGSPFDSGFGLGGTPILRVDPQGQYLYAASDIDCATCDQGTLGQLRQFRIDKSDGALSLTATGDPQLGHLYSSGWNSLSISPDGKFIYCTFSTHGKPSLSGFSINGETLTLLPGMPQELTGSPYANQVSPIDLLMDPGGQVLYVPAQSNVYQTYAYWILDDGSLQEFKVSDNALPKAIDAHGTIGAGSSFKVVGTGTYALDPTTGTVSEVSSVDNIYGSTRIAILSK